MPLSTSDKLGPYEIIEPIGAGGMGEVYRAHDSRLRRDVAIKVSAERFSERFEREARAVASLNHPNICTLFDVGPNYLVMELIEGPTLGEKIKQGPIPLDEALVIAKQIADALEAAHEKGIVHRDLKPGNIKIKPDGPPGSMVKVLDFGLAKMGGTPSAQTEDSPTISMAATQAGVILGTAAYMSPEQARGKVVDKRADIWSFGVVLYEMLTGKRLFHGDDVTDTLAAVLRQEPEWELVPAKVRRLLKKCLEKDPNKRLRDIGDAWALLEETSAVSAPSRSRLGVGWIAATIAILIAGVFAFAYFTKNAPDAAAARFSFAPPFQATSLEVAVSPDGRRIAFGNGGTELWMRSVDSFTAEELPGTAGAFRPFWSSDGRSIGFLSGLQLKTMDAGNRESPVHTLSSGSVYRSGGAWSPEGILYSPEATGIGLYRIPVNGGVSVPVTKLNSARHEIAHRNPQFLPDGRHFIYWIWSTSEENTGIYAGSLDPKEKLPEGPLVRTWREARYAEPGYLLFLQGSRLVAQPFDAARLRLSGQPFSLPELVGRDWGATGRAMFSVSRDGVLAYQEAVPLPGARIFWRDRAGKELRSIEAPQGSGSSSFSLSPDEKRVVVTGEDENTLEDLWVVDLDRATSLRLTAIHGSDQDGVWSPDGRRVTFASNRSGVYDLYEKQADGLSEEQLLLKGLHRKSPYGWSPDGRFLVFEELDPKTGYDIWVLPLEGDRKPFPFLKTEFDEHAGELSPVPDSQGHLWMAYESNETGRNEIYLRPFLPGTPEKPAGSKVRVSTAGGINPKWRKDGRELFYVHDNKLWAVDVKLGGTPEIGAPQALFQILPGVSTSTSGSVAWAPFADGRRFLFREPAGEPAAPKINVVLNWTAELKR